MHSKSVCFAIIGVIKMLDLNFKQMFVINDCLWIKKHNIAILNVKGVNYRCILWVISKNEDVFYKWILVEIKCLLK